MGHYRSEMHVPKYQEEYLEKIKRARELFGFLEFDVEHKHLFTCCHCGCVILLLKVHIQTCPGLSNDARVDFFNAVEQTKFTIMTSLQSNPEIERSKLLQDCINLQRTAFEFSLALKYWQAMSLVYCVSNISAYKDIIVKLNQPSQKEV